MKWLACVLCLGVISPVWATEDVLSGITPSQMRIVLERAGLPVKLWIGPEGPQIWGRLAKQPFNVFFFGCAGAPEPQCREAQFYAGFPIEGVFPSVQINSWNGAHRFGRAYIDADGNAALEMDIDAVGTSEVQLRDALEWWQTLVPQFAAFLDQSMKPPARPSAERAPSPSTSTY